MDSQLAPGCSFGRVLKRVNVEGFTLSETSYPPHFKVPPHSHEQAFFYTVLEGKYTDVFGKTTLTSPDIGLVYHPAGETHSHFSHDTGVRCFNLDVGAYWRGRLQEIALRLERPLELRGGTAVGLAGRIYREFRDRDAAADLAIEALALEMLVLASRQANRVEEQARPLWLLQTRDILHAGFAEKLTLPQIAAEVGVHPVHLARVFRQHYHCTIADYMRELRVAFACRQLAHPDTSLVVVALEAGFADQSQFTRTFKRVVGMTPAQYRAEIRRC